MQVFLIPTFLSYMVGNGLAAVRQAGFMLRSLRPVNSCLLASTAIPHAHISHVRRPLPKRSIAYVPTGLCRYCVCKSHVILVQIPTLLVNPPTVNTRQNMLVTESDTLLRRMQHICWFALSSSCKLSGQCTSRQAKMTPSAGQWPEAIRNCLVCGRLCLARVASISFVEITTECMPI
jgi:hypothetical protein